MKKYKVDYRRGNKPNLLRITEISKSEKRGGTTILLLDDGRKYWQANFKNGLLNGLEKNYYDNAQNDIIINFKKNIEQGIQIDF